MAPDLCKWAALAQLAWERFPEDPDVAGALALAATCVAEGERAEEAVVAAAVEAEAERVHAAVAEAAARDIATVGSTAGPFLRPYLAAADLIAEADDAAMAEVEVVAAAQPQEAEDDDLDGLFDDEKVVSAMSDEQAVLLASFETARREEDTRLFMAAEREALSAMLVVRAAAAKRVAAEMAAEEAALGAALAEEIARDRARWEANRAAARSRRDAANVAAADLEARRWGKVERCLCARQEVAIARAQQAIDDAAPRVEWPWADVVAEDDDVAEE
jgi:hypothetical protein